MNRFLKLLFCASLIFNFQFSIFNSVQAQGTVKGVLFDDANGEAVPFANVILDGTAYGCATDLNGFFLINKVPAGKYTLRVRFMGYEEHSEQVTIVDHRTVTLTIHLKPAAQMLKTVEITTARPRNGAYRHR